MTDSFVVPDLEPFAEAPRVADPFQLASVLGLSQMTGERLAAGVADSGHPPAVVANLLGLAGEDAIAAAASTISGAPVWSGVIATDPAASVSEAFLTAHYALLLGYDGEAWDVGLVDPSDQDGREGIAFTLGPVRFHTIPLSVWRSRQKTEDQEASAGPSAAGSMVGATWTDDAGRLRDFSRDTPAVRLADDLLERAFLARASDLHVEQKSDSALVRFRIDGLLRDVERLTPSIGPALIARIKVLCDLDVAARRTPQDGRTTVSVRGAPVDIRVSTTPTVHGESLVVRLLHRRDVAFDLDQLGFSPTVPTLLARMLERQHGLILVTGPTGSGKTTTLYAALRRLVSEARKILTVEDPVEYVFESINQTQVNEAAGVTFASALRSFLRHDPDVILVGEIRDTETARLAIQASLTGHLVLATLHTNDAVSAAARLADMGVERYLLAGVLIGAVAQRLAPALCPDCSNPAELSPAVTARLIAMGVSTEGGAPRQATGCPSCGGTGRAGRVPVGEAFCMDETLERLVVEGAPTSALRQHLLAHGFRSLERDALARALAGDVDVGDALRATAG